MQTLCVQGCFPPVYFSLLCCGFAVLLKTFITVIPHNGAPNCVVLFKKIKCAPRTPLSTNELFQQKKKLLQGK